MFISVEYKGVQKYCDVYEFMTKLDLFIVNHLYIVQRHKL